MGNRIPLMSVRFVEPTSSGEQRDANAGNKSLKERSGNMTQKRRDSLCGYHSAESCGYGRDTCPKDVWCPIQAAMLIQGVKKLDEEDHRR